MGDVEPSSDEIEQLIERFGLELAPFFEGPALECPVCLGTIDQLALTLDISGAGELACADCGAVLAA